MKENNKMREKSNLNLIRSLAVIMSLGLTLIWGVKSVMAVAPCAICVVAIGSGLGISRALGIDDALVGVWVGAFLLAIGGFTASWIKKKWPKMQKWAGLISYGGTYVLTVPIMAWAGLFGRGGLGVWLQSNLLIGMLIGTIMLMIGLWLDSFLRQMQKEHKAFFPFQKVIVPVLVLVVATILTWLITS